MSKRQIIAILMLSPFYFSMTLKQRLEIILLLSDIETEPDTALNPL